MMWYGTRNRSLYFTIFCALVIEALCRNVEADAATQPRNRRQSKEVKFNKAADTFEHSNSHDSDDSVDDDDASSWTRMLEDWVIR